MCSMSNGHAMQLASLSKVQQVICFWGFKAILMLDCSFLIEQVRQLTGLLLDNALIGIHSFWNHE